MRILLTAINAKYIHSNLAVYSLKGSAGKYEPMTELAEYTINHQMEEIFAGIYRKKPELLLFSCYIWNRREVVETAESIKKVLPDVKMCMLLALWVPVGGIDDVPSLKKVGSSSI